MVDTISKSTNLNSSFMEKMSFFFMKMKKKEKRLSL